MNLYEMFILSIFDIVMTLIVFHGLVKTEKIKAKYVAIYIVLGALTIAIVSTCIKDNILSHLMSTVAAYAWFLIYTCRNSYESIKSKTIIFLAILIALLMIQMTSTMLTGVLIDGFQYVFKYGLIAQLTALIVTALIMKFVPISSLYVYIENKNNYFALIVTNIFILYYAFSILFFMDFKNLFESAAAIILSVIFTIFINTVFIKESLLNKSYIEKLAVYDTYIPIIDNLMEEIRVKQHDYHNQVNTMITIKNKVSNELSSTFDKYIAEAEGENIWRELLSLHNKIVMALFYSKYSNAKEKNIEIKFYISNYFLKSQHTDYELVEMYGILIDNAIEATEKIENSRTIFLCLDLKDGFNSFKITNPSKYISYNDMSKFTDNGFTTKQKNGHGRGLNKLKNMLDKKNGTIFFNYDVSSEIFTAEIIHN